MSANNVKFRQAVVPGDTLEIRAKITKIKGNRLAQAECQCLVLGNLHHKLTYVLYSRRIRLKF